MAKSVVRSIYDEFIDSTLDTPQNISCEFWADSKDLIDLTEKACVRCVYNFDTALGVTIVEKMEGVVGKIYEIINVIQTHGGSGYFWVATNRGLAIWIKCLKNFEQSKFKYPDAVFDNQLPIGTELIFDWGTYNNDFRLFVCDKLHENKILIGVNNDLENYMHYGQIKIENFII